jgi:uncharacterized membrane protein
MALNLWVAAGLLRLASVVTWSELAAVAAVIAIRRLLEFALLRHPLPRSQR